MEIQELKTIVEALIFVSDEPITERQLLEVLQDASVTAEELEKAIDAIRQDANSNTARGLQLCEVAGGYQFRTKESCATWIQKLSVPKPVKLSQPSLETLAIIAYRQPIVRSEIEQIRGVDVGATLKTLLERNLIRIIGRRDEPGQPLIYGTSKEFLETFNLKNLHDLPTLADIEELARRQVETQTPAQLSIVQAQDEEEPTEIIDNEDEEEEEEEEEETDVIPKEEEEDEEALLRLEKGLKELRCLERDIFPKQAETQEGQNASAEQTAPSGDEAKPAEPLSPSPDEIAKNDRTDN
jgi:segregation and condensation protein B